MRASRFHSAREAKEFIAAQIADQAMRDAVLFTDVERKMLLFSEVGWAPPDSMEVAAEFERQFDSAEYEKKVATIIKHVDKRLRKDSPPEYDDWRSAVKCLKRKDHYVNVVIAQADLRPPWDQLKLFAAALVLVVGFVCWLFISSEYGLGKYFPENFGKNLTFAFDVAVIVLTILSVLVPYLYYLFAAKRTPNFLNKILIKIFADSRSVEKD